MLTLYTLLLLTSLKLGYADEVLVKLDLSSELNQNVTKNYLEFDNVSYVVYKPVNDEYIHEVVEGSDTVWSGSHTYDRAKSVIVAYNNLAPALLYIYTPLYTYYKFYYVRVNGKWVNSSYDWYAYRLELIKEKKTGEFSMDLSFTKSTSKFYYGPKSESKNYETFIPFNGYYATSVNYNLVNLWTSKSPGERAIVAWAYTFNDVHFLIKILVCDLDSNYKFYDFIRLRSHWVDMEQTPLSLKPRYKFPDDIHFPQYLLLKAVRRSHSRDYRTVEIRKGPIATPSNYDFTYHNKPIPIEKCYNLDFSKKVLAPIGTKVSSVFSNKLNVVSYFPLQGSFFCRVSDGRDTIYQRDVDVEACVAVHFYTKNEEPYLADVVVTNPIKPRSEYHVKIGGKWSPINDGKFFNLIKDLREQLMS